MENSYVDWMQVFHIENLFPKEVVKGADEGNDVHHSFEGGCWRLIYAFENKAYAVEKHTYSL